MLIVTLSVNIPTYSAFQTTIIHTYTRHVVNFLNYEAIILLGMICHYIRSLIGFSTSFFYVA
ncbi:hypothetical protein BDB00DRAFT_798265 [Zychaea mexicana]|uniref:uncharacterized protein n=1 Tax=Zychaea mexicana TaxID=64656 RepID=UPI0022FE6CC9|nr:uncharacterized protein BDB00DRAFT_798265 [Zychaea mexicana]KAI9499083.1 hypothetical protein BDB00DRAFT_798265 [Zychaea mexicana]